jgi:electron transfer flavoprotein alpha subunit
MPNILVFAEARNDAVRKVAFELLTAARKLSAGGEVHAVLAGAAGIGTQAASLAGFGADVIHVTEHPALAEYNAESLAALIAGRAKSGSYRSVLFSASAQGKDLGPRVAARLGVPIASDSLSVSFDGDATVVTHYVYAGKIIATLRLAAIPAVVALRPGAVSAVEAKGAGRVEPVPPVGDPSNSRVVVTESIRGDSRKLDLSDAPIIVSGGRGLKAAEHFKLVRTQRAQNVRSRAAGLTKDGGHW